jgi:hypothetical protein
MFFANVNVMPYLLTLSNMKTILPLTKKANRYVYVCYSAVTVIIIMLVSIGKVSYGPDVQDSLMPIMFFIIWLFLSLFRWITSKITGLTQIILLLLSPAFMIFMIGYYFLENSFRIH